MHPGAWLNEFAGVVIVTDLEGKILEMNQRAIEQYEADGGAALIGKSVLACHPEPAREKLQALLVSGARNVYTVEKRGKKKLVYQAPWYCGGKRAGLVELTFEIPEQMPHFVRRD